MLYWLLVIIGAVGLDQLTKWLAVTYLKGNASFPLWQDVLHFTYVENTGAAFGSFKDHRWLFMITSTLLIIALIAYFLAARPKDKLTVISLAFITGGGIGNMIDRILLGYVVDFIDFTLIDFAVFNVADSFVCVGVGLMFLALIRETRLEAKQARAVPAEAEADAVREEERDDDSSTDR